MKKDLWQLLDSVIDINWIKQHTIALNKLEKNTANADFEASTDYVLEVLKEAGFEDIERYALPCDGVTSYDDCTMPEAWDRTGRSTLEVLDADFEGDRMLADTDIEPLNATIWSPPTPEGGITAELISAKALESDDWHEAKGKIVLCHISPNGDFMRKLVQSGAVGLVSYVEAIAETHADSVRWMNGVGFCGWYYVKENPRIWNYSITPRKGLALQARLDAGKKVTLHAVMNTRVYDGEIYTVTARIPGSSSDEVALLAHMYEPFPGDDASGVITSIAVGKALKELADSGKMPKLAKSIRVVFSMERFGFSEYFFNPKRMKKVLATINMDTTVLPGLRDAGIPLELRHSPAAVPHFGEILLRNYFGGNTEYAYQETPGNLSDDTFSADPMIGAPCNWLHTPPPVGQHHNNGGIFADVDWDMCQATTNAVAAYFAEMAFVRRNFGLRELVKEVFSGVKSDAKNDFKRLEDKIQSGELNSYAGNVIGDFLVSYHIQRITALNKFVKQAVDIKAARREIKKLADKYAPSSRSLDIYELSPAEARMAYTVVTRTKFAQPMSLAGLPEEKRYGFMAKPSMLLCSLLDGKRSLYDAYVISTFMLREQVNFKSVSGVYNFFKTLAQYDLCRIEENTKLQAADLASALQALGVKKTDKVVVHSAYSSLGGVEGGPKTVVDVLADHLGEKGLLMMPSFNFPFYMNRSSDKYFDVKNTPSCVGVVTDEFRKRADVYRSLNPSHSMAVLGKKNFHWVADHHKTLTMGQDSPLGKLEQADGYALMISCPDSVTFMHIVEATNRAHCLGYRSEEFDVKLPNGEIKPVRTWGWRKLSCIAYNRAAIFNYMRKHNLIAEVMVRHSCWQYFKLSDYRKAYEKVVIHGRPGKSCISCSSCPRTVPQTVISDWDFDKNAPRPNTTAFVGDWDY